jgi:PEGA domain-containing protein/protein kinase-like protein
LGPVFRAYDPERDVLVAVKLFTLDLPPERGHQLVAEFERLIGLTLTHEAIASLVATGLVDTSPYLAQQYVAAESLDLAVRQYGPAPAADALRVAAQLAGALDFAAVVNIHHGALNPRDVLLSAEDTKLTGLGVARALEQVGVTAPVRRPYSAPERIAGAPWDRRADVFSLAVLIHELLWGRRIAGTGARVVESLTEIAGGDLTALRSVFSRALADNPAVRFSTALEFAEALAHAFPNVAVAAAAAPPIRQAAPPPQPIAESIEPRLPLDDAGHPPAVNLRDLDLRAAEATRYDDVAVAPAIVDVGVSEPATAHEEERERDAVSVPVELITSQEPARPPSRTWPLVAMLMFGVVAGLAAGYLVWSRPDPVAPPQETAVSVPTKPAPPPGREFTETTVQVPPSASNARASGANDRSAAANAHSDAASDRVGRVLVRSTPAGATVFVDGKEHGQTPTAVRELAPGQHRVRLERDGYAPAERRVLITASQPAQSIIVPLAEARATASGGTRSANRVPTTPATLGHFSGALIVESKPAGAKVYVDNKLAGTTPLSMQNVPAGSHAIRLERDGYRRWSSSVRVVAAERNRVTASLER